MTAGGRNSGTVLSFALIPGWEFFDQAFLVWENEEELIPQPFNVKGYAKCLCCVNKKNTGGGTVLGDPDNTTVPVISYGSTFGRTPGARLEIGVTIFCPEFQKSPYAGNYRIVAEVLFTKGYVKPYNSVALLVSNEIQASN